MFYFIAERCPSGDDPYTSVEETNCHGISQIAGTVLCCVMLCIVFFVWSCCCLLFLKISLIGLPYVVLLLFILGIQVIQKRACLEICAMLSVLAVAFVTIPLVHANALKAAGVKRVKTLLVQVAIFGIPALTPQHSDYMV